MARRVAAEKYTAEELSKLPQDIRAEIIASGGGETRSAVPVDEAGANRALKAAQAEFDAAAGPRRIRKAVDEPKLDDTPTQVLIMAHNMPAGMEYVDEAEDGEEPKLKLIERRFRRKERPYVPKWIADLLVEKDLAVFL